ncbi:elongation factor G [Bacillus sp. SD088]|uniref:elongation factor G n=1 Tax=Bacillus sp. SD088 TaxID=2782012 RepID=UPI001A9686ED|nr:TetM/TetW/TetO/TetS family tetracycline resistance ribosomal protection protein [Bacillus sp. SD088]MBO0996125.1 TetM/TetW/TetO/TetS family tetracycline resistance ribosomal protection protein [Bacillus sp. SD088]
MKILNIGILAHVDAGKTTLTENILYETKVINELGRVDKGNTQTDSMDLERRRGITIKASTVSFTIQDLKVNLIDTPGHADFISEVERSTRILDGAILVISAVEGIQAQTKILMNSLMKLKIPTLLFINKIDRSGADSSKVIQSIEEKLTNRAIPLYMGVNEGTDTAQAESYDFGSEAFVEKCIDVLSMNNEALLEDYVNGKVQAKEALRHEISQQSKEGKVFPVFIGSAVKGIGVKALLDSLEAFLPVNCSRDTAGDPQPLSAVVFKIEREHSGEKKAYVRVFSGVLRVREEVLVSRRNSEGELEPSTDKVKMLSALREGKTLHAEKIEAGDIGIVHGLKSLKIGDVLGEWSDKIRNVSFAEPNMETRIEALYSEDTQKLFEVLTSMAEEDPLIKISRDDFNREIYISLFGEVQKEVIKTVLQEQDNIEVGFSETRIICMEKPKAAGSAVEVMGSKGNPFYATVGFRVEPSEQNSGIIYKLDVELGSLPLSFQKAIEDTVYHVLKQGLYGWEVTDVIVTLTHTAYASPVSTAGDFRHLTPLVLMEALSKAGTEVYEPINSFELRVPAQALSKAIFNLSTMKADFNEPALKDETVLITGSIPVATTEPFKVGLHSYTEGEGIFIARPSGYKKIDGEIPTRKRSDYNPLNKKEYLMHVQNAVRR